MTGLKFELTCVRTKQMISVTHHFFGDQLSNQLLWQNSSPYCCCLINYCQGLKESCPPLLDLCTCILLFCPVLSILTSSLEAFSNTAFTPQGLLPLLGPPQHSMCKPQRAVISWSSWVQWLRISFAVQERWVWCLVGNKDLSCAVEQVSTATKIPHAAAKIQHSQINKYVFKKAVSSSSLHWSLASLLQLSSLNWGLTLVRARFLVKGTRMCYLKMCLWHKDCHKLIIFRKQQTQENIWKLNRSYPFVKRTFTLYVYIF